MVRRANDSTGLPPCPWRPLHACSRAPSLDRPTPLLGPHCQLPLLLGASRSLTAFHPDSPAVVTSGFVVPPCRGRRALVSVVDSGAGFTVTRLRAYQVTNLAPGTKY